MSQEKTFAVITSIQPPTACVRRLCERLRPQAIPLIVVGDKKGPFAYDVDGAELITLAQQASLPFSLAPLLPTGHYARKNLGYLTAISRGARCLYETDDDNAPNRVWKIRTETASARRITASGWYNVYRLYSDENVWPRGLPLDRVTAPFHDEGFNQRPELIALAPVQQGLANGSPDVDAVWRLTLDKNITFKPGPDVLLPRGAWCPFNSQATWWWAQAFPLLYLPSHCSFRMTDIWRSFIAQRCLWEFADGMLFHGAEVDQERNQHNLMRDFSDEIPGYLNNARIATLLENLPLRPGVAAVRENLSLCYVELIKAGIFPATEKPLVEAWLADLDQMLS